MKKKAIDRADLVRSTAFPPAMAVGGMLYVSGAGASDLTKDCRGQSEEVFEYLSSVLAEAGGTLADVVKIQCFLSRQSDYEDYNLVRRRYFPTNPPASTTVLAGLVRPEMLVEVDAIACITRDET